MITSRKALRLYIAKTYSSTSTVYPAKTEALFAALDIAKIHELDLLRFAVKSTTYKHMQGVVFYLSTPASSVTYLPRTFGNCLAELALKDINPIPKPYKNCSFVDLTKNFPHVKSSNGKGYGDWFVIELPLAESAYFHPDANYIIGDSAAWLCFMNRSKAYNSRIVAKEHNDMLLYVLASAYFNADEEVRKFSDNLWESEYPMQGSLQDEAQHIIDEWNEAHGGF